jgi:hypothetical protein
MRHHRFWAAFAITLVGVTASADTLVTSTIPFSNLFLKGSPMGPFKDDVVFSLGLRSVPPRTTPRTPPATVYPIVFDRIRLKPTDVGVRFTVTAADDPDFPAFVEFLNNGAYDELVVSSKVFAESGYGPAYPEATSERIGSWSEFPYFSMPGQADLQLYQVDSISLRLDSLVITDNVTVPTLPQFPGRQFTGSVTVTVEGIAVPEPATGVLVGFAAFASLVRRPRRATQLTSA